MTILREERGPGYFDFDVRVEWSNEYSQPTTNACRATRWSLGYAKLTGVVVSTIGMAISGERMASVDIVFYLDPEIPDWVPAFAQDLLRQVEPLARPCR